MVEDLEIKTSTKLGNPRISGIRRQTKRRIVIDIRTDLPEVRMVQHIEEACLECETILFCEAEALDGCNIHICIEVQRTLTPLKTSHVGKMATLSSRPRADGAFCPNTLFALRYACVVPQPVSSTASHAAN